MSSKKKTKKQIEALETISNFSEFFDSMDEELLAEMAYYYPKQLSTMCIFLALDYQLALEEHQRISNKN